MSVRRISGDRFCIRSTPQGYSVLFLTAADLVAECHRAEAKGMVSRLIKKWTRPDLIVLDEVGYFPFDEFSANIFFQVISKKYEHGVMILTSNKSFIEWGADDVLATAILDRLLHHTVTFNIKGDSYRLKEKKKAGIYPAVPPAN